MRNNYYKNKNRKTASCFLSPRQWAKPVPTGIIKLCFLLWGVLFLQGEVKAFQGKNTNNPGIGGGSPTKTDSLRMKKLRDLSLSKGKEKGGSQAYSKMKEERRRIMLQYEKARDSIQFVAGKRRLIQKIKQKPDNAPDQSIQVLSTSTFDLVPDHIELAALEDLYNSTYGYNWSQQQNWLAGTTSADFATWYGIEVRNGDVYGIQLDGNSLDGIVPASIGNLSKLEVLSMSANYISDGLPSSIGNLTGLKVFDVS